MWNANGYWPGDADDAIGADGQSDSDEENFDLSISLASDGTLSAQTRRRAPSPPSSVSSGSGESVNDTSEDSVTPRKRARTRARDVWDFVQEGTDGLECKFCLYVVLRPLRD